MKEKLIRILSLAIILILLLVLVISFRYPANNLLPLPMLVASFIAVGALLGAFGLWSKVYPIISKYEPWLYFGGLILFGVILFGVSYGRDLLNTNSHMDYRVVFYSAEEYAAGRKLDPESYYFSYFANYNNNLRPMLLLSMIFRVADLLHVSHFHFALLLVCLQVVGTAWSIGILASSKGNRVWRVPSLFLFMGFLPLWCMTAAFYTDTMSMGVCIISMALIKIVNEKEFSSISRGCLIVCAGLLIVLATIWKITAIIPFLAYVLTGFLCKKKYSPKLFLSLVVAVVIFWGGFSVLFASHDIYSATKGKADPLLSWVAIGLKGDGSWSENSKFVHGLHELQDTSEKMEYTKEYIFDNREYFGDLEHVTRKIRRNFADGNLETKLFTSIQDDGSVFWDLFNAWGEHNWRISQICFCYLEAIYLCLFGGVIMNLIRNYRGKGVDTLMMSTHVSFLGIFIFLMIWEANSRQMYNQMPMLILGEVLFLKNCFEKAEVIEK